MASKICKKCIQDYINKIRDEDGNLLVERPRGRPAGPPKPEKELSPGAMSGLRSSILKAIARDRNGVMKNYLSNLKVDPAGAREQFSHENSRLDELQNQAVNLSPRELKTAWAMGGKSKQSFFGGLGLGLVPRSPRKAGAKKPGRKPAKKKK